MPRDSLTKADVELYESVDPNGKVSKASSLASQRIILALTSCYICFTQEDNNFLHRDGPLSITGAEPLRVEHVVWWLHYRLEN
jgi:hypothetical protein